MEGRRAPLYPAPDATRFYLEARAGARYAVLLTNRTRERLGVVLTVDGLNAISGERDTGHGRMYVLGPWEQTTVRGWRSSLSDVRQFTFVDERVLVRRARREGQRPHGLDRGRGVSGAAGLRRPAVRVQSPGAVTDRLDRTMEPEAPQGAGRRKPRRAPGRGAVRRAPRRPRRRSASPRATARTRPSRRAPISTGPRRRRPPPSPSRAPAGATVPTTRSRSVEFRAEPMAARASHAPLRVRGHATGAGDPTEPLSQPRPARRARAR